jgi:tetratricopeptide (TPR) repeat protein
VDPSQEDCLKPSEYLAVTHERAREELETLLSEPLFHCSERNKKFLRFISEELFAGRESALKAYSIAVDVFGRPPSFDASTDPIVRIEATRLRSALARYYELYGQDREVSIELPKGRYVPMFSRHVREPGEWADHPGGKQPRFEAHTALESTPTQAIGRGVRTILKRTGLAGVALLGVALFAGVNLLNGLNSMPVSERPSLSVDLDGSDDHEAVALRDSLMAALSGFSTLRLSTPDLYTASTTDRASAVPKGSNYRLVLKYSSDASLKTVWWQIIDQQTGEALQSGNERVSVDAISSADRSELLVSRLAARIASANGVINSIEATRDLEHPTLGNGCVLRAGLALNMRTPQLLEQARRCLERTLEQQPYDADAHAMLAPVLLSIDSVETPTALTAAAHEHASRAVALAPESSRAFMAKMMVEFQTGHLEAAISAGRRAVALNPYNTSIEAKFARILYSAGKLDEGVKLASKALETDGLPLADAEWTLAFDAYRRGQFGEVMLRLQRTTDRPCYVTDLLMAATLASLGRDQEAFAVVSGIRKTRPDFERSFLFDMSRRHLDPQLVAALGKGLESAGVRHQ